MLLQDISEFMNRPYTGRWALPPTVRSNPDRIRVAPDTRLRMPSLRLHAAGAQPEFGLHLMADVRKLSAPTLGTDASLLRPARPAISILAGGAARATTPTSWPTRGGSIVTIQRLRGTRRRKPRARPSNGTRTRFYISPGICSILPMAR